MSSSLVYPQPTGERSAMCNIYTTVVQRNYWLAIDSSKCNYKSIHCQFTRSRRASNAARDPPSTCCNARVRVCSYACNLVTSARFRDYTQHNTQRLAARTSEVNVVESVVGMVCVPKLMRARHVHLSQNGAAHTNTHSHARRSTCSSRFSITCIFIIACQRQSSGRHRIASPHHRWVSDFLWPLTSHHRHVCACV